MNGDPKIAVPSNRPTFIILGILLIVLILVGAFFFLHREGKRSNLTDGHVSQITMREAPA